jgi:hypothetical protein
MLLRPMMTRREAILLTDEQLADVHRVEAIDVLVRPNAADDGIRVDVLRQRHLHQNSMHGRVGVQPVDAREQVFLRRRRGKPDRVARHPCLLARLALGADVDGTRRIITDKDDGEARRDPTLPQPGYLARDILAHAARDRDAVDALSGQSLPPASRE